MNPHTWHMIYITCYFLVIGTDIKFNHTNSAIHSSGHSHSLFTSASDYASAQWRLVLHILVTCSPHVNKCWVTLAIYGIRCGWSHWPITIQHVRVQSGSIVSWLACSAGSERAARVSRSTGDFSNGLKKYLQFFFHWLKRITCWCVVSLSLTWCRIMAVRKCCTFRLKRKNILPPTPDACCALLTLRSIQLMTGEPRPPVQRAPVTWCEWGLWFSPPDPTAIWHSHLALAIYIFVVVNFDALAQGSDIRI